uniref:Scavenger receptor class B member 1 n=1 Tax=Dermatophagoides pteronyssinus TaxID=6956 RepID=A0A6P6YA67_DERPT|nr:sensory neuron membrane protein 2-like [Dermatophagoides pteronyssinus]
MGNIVIRMLMTKLAEHYSSKKTERFLVIFGIFYLLFGIVFYFGFNEIVFNPWLEWFMKLKPSGGMIMNIWQQSDSIINVWLFSIENGPKFLTGKQTIRLNEIGPFCFHSKHQRIIIDWPSNYQLIRFNESFHYEFVQENSIGPLSMMIKTINLPLLTILGNSHNNNSLLMDQNLTKRIEDELIIEKSVGQILGIDNHQNITDDDDGGGGFSFFDHNKQYGPIELYTGQRYARKLNQYYSLFFGPKQYDNLFVNIFDPRYACRSFRFLFDSNDQFDWIQTQYYRWDSKQFSLEYYPDNWCYCPDNIDNDDDDCEGRFYLNRCYRQSDQQQQQWLVITNVHFLHTKNLARMVRGLRPDLLRHSSYLQMEPTFGVTVDSRFRLQYNFNLMQPFYQNLHPNVPHKPTVIPFLWIEEVYTVNGYLKMLLQFCSIFFIIISHFYTFIAAFGVCLIMIGVVRWLKKLIKNRMAVNDDDDNKDKS